MKPPTGKIGNDKRQRKLTFDIDGRIKINTPQKERYMNSKQVVKGNITKKNEKNKI